MTSPNRPRVFLDALGGQDGTQAIRARYDVAPVYPDASLGTPVRQVRPVAGPAVVVAVTVAQAPPAAAPRPVPPRPVQQRQRATPRAAGGVVSAPYALPTAPSRQAAARATHYQGPVPIAVAPAAATQYNVPMTYAPQPQTAAFLPSRQPARAGMNRAATPQRAAPTTPAFAPPTLAPPLPAQRWQTRPTAPRKKSNWVQAVIALIIFGLVGSGLGGKILDALRQLLQR